MGLTTRRRTLFLAWAAAVVVADDADESLAPVASALSATFIGSSTTTADVVATVSPSSGDRDARGSSSATAAAATTTTTTTTAPLFTLVHSAASSSATTDVLEIARSGVADAPRIAFESLVDTAAWDVSKWENPLTQLANTIANDKIDVAGGDLRLAIQLTDAVSATSVSFAKTSEWHYGPTLVLEDDALSGLAQLKTLEFSNFNVTFEGSKWLAAGTSLAKLAFDKSIIASFSLASTNGVTDAEWRDSSVARFPSALLSLTSPPTSLTIASCNFSEPFKLSAADLKILQNIPNVTLSQNAFPEANATDCAKQVTFQDAVVCVTTSSEAGTPDSETTTSSTVDTLAPSAPLDSQQSNLSNSRGTLHTVIAVVCVVGSIALVAGFVWVRRRKSPADQPDQLTFTNHNDKFLTEGEDERDGEDADVARFHGESVLSARATPTAMGILSDVDLGGHSVMGESRLGPNGLWRAEYSGDRVVALRVHVENFKSRGRDVESVVASCVALRHPYVVEFLGTSRYGADELWLVAECMAKGSLRSVLLKKKVELTWDKVKSMSLQIASALAFVQSVRAASARVTPTLSSKSVLCDNDLNCKLDVFEFAESTRDQKGPLQSYGDGEICYRAPELLQSNNASQLPVAEAAAAEVYALGVLFCELTHQSHVYGDILAERGATLGEMFIAKEVAAGRLRPEPVANTPSEYAKIIEACVSHRPAVRPSVSELVDWLTGMEC